MCIAFSVPFTACGALGGIPTGGTDGKEISMVVENAERDIYREWFNEFEQLHKDEGYKVNLIPVGGGQVQGKQDNMMAAGTPPDIIVGGDVHIQNQRKYLLPLDDLIEKDNAEVDIDDFMPEIMDLLKYEGQTLYLPNYFNTSLLYYNTEIFDEYNAGLLPGAEKLSYPTDEWTYDTFLDAAKKLTVSEGGAYTQWGCYSTIGWWGEWLIHVRQAGGEIMDENGLVTLDTPQAIAGFNRYLAKMNGEDKVSYTKGELDLGGFTGKKTAMLYGGHIKDWSDMKKVKDLKWDIALLPTVNGNRTGELSVNALGIHKASRSQTAAWELIKFLTRKRTGTELADYCYISARISEKNERLAVPVEERGVPKNLEAVYDSLQYNKILPQQKYFTYVLTKIVQTELDKAVEGIVSGEEAMKTATKNANNYIRTNYM